MVYFTQQNSDLLWKHIALNDFVATAPDVPVDRQFSQIIDADELVVVASGITLYYIANANKTIDISRSFCNEFDENYTYVGRVIVNMSTGTITLWHHRKGKYEAYAQISDIYYR